MKYKKKHQKQLLNFSILILFLLVLNINFTFTVKNLEFKYTEDIYEENYEDLTPELIIESPKNANYIDQLDFMPYGTYIYAPKYAQRFVGQSSSNYISFRLHDSNGGWFSDFEIYVDDILSYSALDYWAPNTIDFDISYLISTNGVHDIEAKAFSDRSHEWITHNLILNVTPTSPCITPFYDDFMHTQYWEGSVDWNIYTSNSRNYNYTIFINDIEVFFENRNYWENYINFGYTSYGDFNTIDLVNEIRLEIIDEVGEKTINEFEIMNVPDSEPYIQYLDRNCYELNYITLWETEGFKLMVEAYSSQNILDKIVLLVNNLPIHTMFNASSGTQYEIPVDTNSFIKLKDENGYINNNVEFRAIAVNKYGRSSNWDYSPSQYMELRYYNYYPQLKEKTEDVGSGRNIETLRITEEFDSDIEYSLTVVTDVITPTTLTIAGSNGRSFEDSTEIWEHCYDNNNGICEIFGGYNENDDWSRGGIVFWVSVANQSAVQFPMIVKIVYPDEIQPDGINSNWNLQFMHWRDNCESQERGWLIYRNESVSANRDETLKDVGDKAIEVLIYSPGLYAFGIEPGNENRNSGLFISSFPIGLLSFSVGIAIVTISLISKDKMKKK